MKTDIIIRRLSIYGPTFHFALGTPSVSVVEHNFGGFDA